MATAQAGVVHYPSGDGQPMGETGFHVRAIHLLFAALEDFFRDHRSDVFIFMDQFWYWEEGNPSKCLAPDLLVVTGTHPRDPRERRRAEQDRRALLALRAEPLRGLVRRRDEIPERRDDLPRELHHGVGTVPLHPVTP